MLEDEDDGTSRSLVRPDMATAQTKFRLYTRSICPEIVRLLNVIAGPRNPPPPPKYADVPLCARVL